MYTDGDLDGERVRGTSSRGPGARTSDKLGRSFGSRLLLSNRFLSNRLIKLALAVTLGGVVLLTGGCGGAGAGEYSGTAYLDSGGDTPLDMDMEIEQGGDDPEGSITMVQDEQTLQFEISGGSIEDGDVQLSAEGQWQINVDGQLEGSTMSGSLYVPAFEENGEFEVSRQ